MRTIDVLMIEHDQPMRPLVVTYVLGGSWNMEARGFGRSLIVSVKLPGWLARIAPDVN